MVRFAIAFLAGVCLFQAMPQIPPLFVIGICVFIAIFTLLYTPIRTISFIILGFFWSWGFALFLLANQITEPLASSISTVVGKIIDIPYQDDSHFSKFKLSVSSYKTDKNDWQTANINIQLYWYKDAPKINAGDQWQLEVSLKPPVSYANPGGFDREKWLYVNHIQATGSVKRSTDNHLIKRRTGVSISALRQQISELINSESGYQHPDLLNALSVGNKQSISQESWKLLQDTGTAHLIAISGLHVGLVSGIVVLLIAYVWRMTPYSAVIPALKIAAVAGIITSIVYTALAGFAIPTARAMIMIIALYLSTLLNFSINPWNVLATALTLIIFINPVSVLSSGFWLSFLAVTWILYYLVNRSNRERKFKIALKLQFVLAAGLLPVMLTDFQQISLVAPIANLVAVPFASLFIVPGIMMAMISLPFSELIFLKILYVADYLIMLLFKWLNLTGSLDIASYPASISKYLLLVLVPGLMLLLSPLGAITKVAGILVLGSLPFWKPALPDKGEVWMTVLDVGQGLSIVLQTRHHVLVYDAGPVFPSGYNMGKRVVLPFLRKSGIRRIDMLMISHSDTDHSGGAQAIFDSLRTDSTLAGEPGEISWAKSNHCQENTIWVWDDVMFSILSPATEQAGNNGSCVLQVTDASGVSILIPGDIEWPVEHQLVKSYQDRLHSDILIAPHHGSKTSSRLSFLKLVSPKSVIVPAGYKNRYGFPHSSNVDKYRALDARIYITGVDGAIFVKSDKDAGGYTIDTYRRLNKHYWQTPLK